MTVGRHRMSRWHCTLSAPRCVDRCPGHGDGRGVSRTPMEFYTRAAPVGCPPLPEGPCPGARINGSPESVCRAFSL